MHVHVDFLLQMYVLCVCSCLNSYPPSFAFPLSPFLAGFCCKCAVKKGERTEKIFASIPKPNYSPLLSLSFWLNSGAAPDELQEEHVRSL